MHGFYPVSRSLGVIVCQRAGHPPFAESEYLHKLVQTGFRLGLQVIVFDPQSWNPDDNTVQGWTLHEQKPGWHMVHTPLPTLVYDRAWPEDEAAKRRLHSDVRRLLDAGRLRMLGAKLPGKWPVYRLLANHAHLQRLLPPTSMFSGPESLHAWLARCGGSAFLKPSCGSQGRRVAACVMQEGGKMLIRGRTYRQRAFNLIFASKAEGVDWLRRWIGNRTYLMQPYLKLATDDGLPCDIRALVQKNGRGRWALTGTAVRIGKSGTVTANLHGGGMAVPAEQWLAKTAGSAGSAERLREIRWACLEIVRLLERNYGRMCELGLDFCLDTSGKLWFLEANSKPGRSAMSSIGPTEAALAVLRPLAYAKSILLRPLGRVIHEFDYV